MENTSAKPVRKKTVHHILAHSYSIYLLSVFIALILDAVFPIRIIPQYITDNLGIFFLVIAPLLIYWAQHTSGSLKYVTEAITVKHFKRGPYKYTRGPTHLGLALLIIGFGILINSLFVIGFTVVAYFVSKSIFLKEQEEMLAVSYGEEYRKYQKEVNPWF